MVALENPQMTDLFGILPILSPFHCHRLVKLEMIQFFWQHSFCRHHTSTMLSLLPNFKCHFVKCILNKLVLASFRKRRVTRPFKKWVF